MRAGEIGAAERVCALYLRLSREDAAFSESASIETQRKILRDFARDRGFTQLREYVDDGWSGTSFERPAFQRLLRDVESGRVGVVITKDVSRLGRNSGRVNLLLDEFFPLHRVRYISVGENHDSAAPAAGADIVLPVLSAVNELYAADISRKIRAAFDAKRRAGEFVGAHAPYGYRKDPACKNRLLPDAEAAEVVRRIFSLARAGHSPAQIAAQLNADGVETPAAYRSRRQGTPTQQQPLWQAASVSKLLRREVYLGHTVQGKTQKPSFKRGEIRSLPKSDWVVVRDTHEALVDAETWEAVRRQLHSRAKTQETGFRNLFSGLAVCADCGKNMSTAPTRKKGARANLVCGGYKLCGRAACQSHAIDYDLLQSAVIDALRSALALTGAEKAQLLAEMLHAAEDTDSEAQRLQKKLAALGGKLEKLYDDKYAGEIGPALFESLHTRYKTERDSLTEKLRRCDVSAQESAEKAALRAAFSEMLEAYTAPKALTPELLNALVARVEVHQGEYLHGVKRQRIDIRLKFSCEEQTLTL